MLNNVLRRNAGSRSAGFLQPGPRGSTSRVPSDSLSCCVINAGAVFLSLTYILPICCLLIGGCQWTEEPFFRLNLEGRNPSDATPLALEEASSFLRELFGTPSNPKLPPGVALDRQRLERSAGEPVGSLTPQRTASIERGLYRRYCATCHGITGDGAGPAALVMDPYPRDFRRGVFVYTSTIAGAKPAREDLRRAIARGLPGSAMPGYSHLSSEEIDSLVEYVIYLSLRGEVELLLLQYLLDEDEPLPLSVIFKERFIAEDVAAIWAEWDLALNQPEKVVVTPMRADYPPDDATFRHSIKQGREIYLSDRAKCATCHGAEGAADGEQANDLYDDWNYVKRVPLQLRKSDRQIHFMLPLRRLRVRNLREDLFRGGADPKDIYKRIYVGLKGTPMAGVGPSGSVPGALSEEEIWHVVDFVLAISAGQKAIHTPFQ